MVISTTFQEIKKKYNNNYSKSVEEFEEYYLRDLAEKDHFNYYTNKEGVEVKIEPINHHPILKEFEVWTEGFAITGQSSGATLHGKVTAESFDQACIKVLGSCLDKDDNEPDGYRRDSEGNMCVWACSCSNNETEARKYFG